ncbi:MAG: beta-eliminating lyase-related protein [Sphingorhabdus sp.]
MRFFSDNAAPVHPEIWAAMHAADHADTAYAGDAFSARLDAAFGALFGTEVAVIWAATGTAANGLALSALVDPYGAILCHREAHLEVDECGGPAWFTHGAKLLLAEGEGAKLTPDAINAVLNTMRGDVHQAVPQAISITQATEYGRVYTPAEVAAIGAVARDRKLKLHMDGARFANAVASLGCHPGDVTWRAGVDVLSFGCIKNGAMSAEAIVFFDPDLAARTRFAHKSAGQLQSKGRYLAAQLLAMIDAGRAAGPLWLENAAKANAAAQIVAEAAGARLLHPVEANEVFLTLSAEEAAALRAQGFDFYDWGVGAARLVTSWASPVDEVEKLAAALRGL